MWSPIQKVIMKAGRTVINIEVTPEQRNAINNYCVSQVFGSRQDILREVILDFIDSKGFPTSINEKVWLRPPTKAEKDDG